MTSNGTYNLRLENLPENIYYNQRSSFEVNSNVSCSLYKRECELELNYGYSSINWEPMQIAGTNGRIYSGTNYSVLQGAYVTPDETVSLGNGALTIIGPILHYSSISVTTHSGSSESCNSVDYLAHFLEDRVTSFSQGGTGKYIISGTPGPFRLKVYFGVTERDSHSTFYGTANGSLYSCTATYNPSSSSFSVSTFEGTKGAYYLNGSSATTQAIGVPCRYEYTALTWDDL